MRKVVVIVFILAIIIAGVFLVPAKNSKNESNISFDSSRVYKNEKYGYEISYPTNWVYREYPDTKTGAGFRPASSPNDYSSEYININVLDKNADMVSAPFEEYAKVAASIEIQNYKSLSSITTVTSSAGITGYETRWNVMPLAGGSAEVSGPITYFPLKDSIQSTIQVSLSNEKFLDVYQRMISTIRYTN